MLKSQKKALEDAEKANMISLEEFLEVEVRPSVTSVRRESRWFMVYDDYSFLCVHSDTNSVRT